MLRISTPKFRNIFLTCFALWLSFAFYTGLEIGLVILASLAMIIVAFAPDIKFFWISEFTKFDPRIWLIMFGFGLLAIMGYYHEGFGNKFFISILGIIVCIIWGPYDRRVMIRLNSLREEALKRKYENQKSQ